MEAGFIDEIQLTVALGMQKQSGLKLGSQLLKLGFIDERKLSGVLIGQMDNAVSLFDRVIPPEAVKSVPHRIAFEHKVIPLAYDGRTIVLATSNPSDLAALDAIAFQVGKKIRPVAALEWEIDTALLKYYTDFSDDELNKLTTSSQAATQYQSTQWSFGNETVFDTRAPSPPAGIARQKTAPPPPPREVPSRQASAPPRKEGGSNPAAAMHKRVALQQKTPPPEKAEEPTPPREALSRLSGMVRKKATLQQALIEVLIEKKLVSAHEILEAFMRLDRTLPEDE